MIKVDSGDKIRGAIEPFEVHSIYKLGSSEELDRVKDFVQKIFREGGYHKTSQSQNLDKWSNWIYLTYFGEIVSAQRVVEKTNENLLTVEQALIRDDQNDSHYRISEKNVADWNSVAFEKSKRGLRAAFVNAGLIARYCLKKNYDLVFGFSNAQKRGIERLYLAHGAKFSEKFSKPVYFPADSLEGNTFDLKIIEISKTALREIASKL